MSGASLQVLRQTLAESSPTLSNVDDEDLDLSETNIMQCKRKIVMDIILRQFEFFPLIASSIVVLDKIKSFPRGTSCGRDWLRLHSHRLLSRVVAFRPIDVGIILRRLVSKFGAIMIGHSLDDYLDDPQFGVGVSRGGEAILHAVNHLIEGCGDDVDLSMLLVDFKNAFNLVDREFMLR
ncbi:hypothetical protein Tco_0095707, partial [Tanacetum coccineum]